MSDQGAARAAVRRLRAHEWEGLRDVRLSALSESPDAFGERYGDANRRLDAEWRERAANGAKSDTVATFVAPRALRFVGMATAVTDPEDPSVTHLYGMWVAPDDRRAGIGRALVEAVVAWATASGAARVVLEATDGNEPALQLYQACGFTLTGERVPLRPGSEIETLRMERLLG